MSRTLLLLAIFAGSLDLLAQPFPIGTRWYYGGLLNGHPGSFELKILEVVDTFTLEGKLAHKIRGHCGSFVPTEHLAFEDRKIYLYYDHANPKYDTTGWLKYYDFNLEAGQTDTSYAPNSEGTFSRYVDYYVDSTSSVQTTTGQSLKVLYTTDGQSGYQLGGTLIEHIGPVRLNCLFPQSGINEDWSEFLCWEINGQTIYSPTGVPCDKVGAVLPDPFDAGFHVQNPVTASCAIKMGKLQGQQMHYTFYHQMGYAIQTGTLLGDTILPTDQLSVGSYFLVLSDETGRFLAAKKVQKIE